MHVYTDGEGQGRVCRMMLVKSVGPYLSVRYILFQYTLVQEIIVQYV